jgi:hypothetical protein
LGNLYGIGYLEFDSLPVGSDIYEMCGSVRAIDFFMNLDLPVPFAAHFNLGATVAIS